MVDSKLHHWTYVSVFLVIFALFLKVRPADIIWDKAQEEISQKQKLYTKSITAKEVDEFILLWPEFVKLGFNDDLIISYHTGIPSRFLDWKAKLWLGYHKWDVNRFFYVEERISEILVFLKNKKEAESILELLKSHNEEVPQELINSQKRILENKEFGETELLLVSARQKLLRELLN